MTALGPTAQDSVRFYCRRQRPRPSNKTATTYNFRLNLQRPNAGFDFHSRWFGTLATNIDKFHLEIQHIICSTAAAANSCRLQPGLVTGREGKCSASIDHPNGDTQETKRRSLHVLHFLAKIFVAILLLIVGRGFVVVVVRVDGENKNK